MDRKQALAELIAKVEAGIRLYPSDTDPVWTVWGDEWKNSRNTILASDGSLDAAKALHDAVLPGWWWVKPDGPESGVIRVVGPDNGDYYPSAIGKHQDPARAWLLAILAALIAQEADQ